MTICKFPSSWQQIFDRGVIESQGLGIFPGYYECGPQLLSSENRRKIEPKEIPSCLIPRLLDEFTRQLEILFEKLQRVTFLRIEIYYDCIVIVEGYQTKTSYGKLFLPLIYNR